MRQWICKALAIRLVPTIGSVRPAFLPWGGLLNQGPQMDFQECQEPP